MKTLLRTTTIALLLLVVCSANALAASETATPATAPFPATATWQSLQSVLAQADLAQQHAVDQMEQARLRQVLALVKAGQPAEVEFAGTLQQTVTPGRWEVAGLALNQTATTAIEGTLANGLHAHVRAQIHGDGSLEALVVHTMTRSDAVQAQHHAAEWLRDDCGVHLGDGSHAGSDDHEPGWQHDTGPAAGQQPAHHPDDPDHHAAQPQSPDPQQPAHHDEPSHDGHDGHHSEHD